MSQTKENNEKSLKQHQQCFQNVILFASNGIGNNQAQVDNKTKDVEQIGWDEQEYVLVERGFD